jgi:hypothetical protein
VSVPAGQQFCHHHDPARANERSRAASKAGRARPSREIVAVKDALRGAISEVHGGQLERGRGAVLAQLYGVLLRALELERKIRETDELLERLEALEAAQGARNGGARTWR